MRLAFDERAHWAAGSARLTWSVLPDRSFHGVWSEKLDTCQERYQTPLVYGKCEKDECSNGKFSELEMNEINVRDLPVTGGGKSSFGSITTTFIGSEGIKEEDCATIHRTVSEDCIQSERVDLSVFSTFDHSIVQKCVYKNFEDKVSDLENGQSEMLPLVSRNVPLFMLEKAIRAQGHLVEKSKLPEAQDDPNRFGDSLLGVSRNRDKNKFFAPDRNSLMHRITLCNKEENKVNQDYVEKKSALLGNLAIQAKPNHVAKDFVIHQANWTSQHLGGFSDSSCLTRINLIRNSFFSLLHDEMQLQIGSDASEMAIGDFLRILPVVTLNEIHYESTPVWTFERVTDLNDRSRLSALRIGHGAEYVSLFARQIRFSMGGLHRLSEAKNLTITMDLQELGSFQIDLECIDNKLRIHFIVERLVTLELMRRFADELSQELSYLGFEKVRFEISHHGHDSSDSQAPQMQQVQSHLGPSDGRESSTKLTSPVIIEEVLENLQIDLRM